MEIACHLVCIPGLCPPARSNRQRLCLSESSLYPRPPEACKGTHPSRLSSSASASKKCFPESLSPIASTTLSSAAAASWKIITTTTTITVFFYLTVITPGISSLPPLLQPRLPLHYHTVTSIAALAFFCHAHYGCSCTTTTTGTTTPSPPAALSPLPTLP